MCTSKTASLPVISISSTFCKDCVKGLDVVNKRSGKTETLSVSRRASILAITAESGDHSEKSVMILTEDGEQFEADLWDHYEKY